MRRLNDRIALVTGAGHGIGLATATLFAAEGAHVFLADIDGTAVEAGAAAISAAGHKATALKVDVSLGQDVTQMFRRIGSQAGRIDALVNNAGVNVRGDFRHLTDAEWVKIREVNLDGVMRVARDGFDLMRASGDASLVNVASIMGHRGMRFIVAYSASKGAVSALTRGLAVEYAGYGIRVNALAPGFIETAMTGRVLKVPPMAKALLERTPQKRFGDPLDVAKAALFLASSESAYITGAEIAVDGGMAASL